MIFRDVTVAGEDLPTRKGLHYGKPLHTAGEELNDGRVTPTARGFVAASGGFDGGEGLHAAAEES